MWKYGLQPDLISLKAIYQDVVNHFIFKINTYLFCNTLRAHVTNKCPCLLDHSKSLNHFLELYTSLVYKAKQKLIDGGHTISATVIKDILTGNWIDNKMIIELFQFHNDQMEVLIEKKCAHGTT